MNRFQFLGRLTKDPEVRIMPNSNNKVTNFTLAVNRRFTDANGERKTDFFNLIAFGKLAEFCEKYYRKGQQVLVEGRIQTRSYEDKDGLKKYATDFIVDQGYFADSRRDQATSEEVPSSSMDGEFITVDDTDDLPF